MTDDVDSSRRHFLSVATAVTGGVGAAVALAPFVVSLKPSARAQALGAPVEIDVEPAGTRRNGPRGMARPASLGIAPDPGDARSARSKVGEFLRDPDSEESEQPRIRHRTRPARCVPNTSWSSGSAPTWAAPRSNDSTSSRRISATTGSAAFIVPCHGSKVRPVGARLQRRSGAAESAGTAVPLRQRRFDPRRCRVGGGITWHE